MDKPPAGWLNVTNLSDRSKCPASGDTGSAVTRAQFGHSSRLLMR